MRATAVAKGAKDSSKSKDTTAVVAADSADEDDFPLLTLDEVEDAEEAAAAAVPVTASDAEAVNANGAAVDDDAASDDSFLYPWKTSTKDKLAKVAAERAEAEAQYITAVSAALPVGHCRLNPG
jgi:hypothetical protein